MIATITEKVERDTEVDTWEDAINLLLNDSMVDVCVTIPELKGEDKDITVYYDGYEYFTCTIEEDYCETKNLDNIISFIKKHIGI